MVQYALVCKKLIFLDQLPHLFLYLKGLVIIMSNTKNAKKSFLIQGSILAGAGIITKIIGFIYRIPMSNLLGDRGNGIYTVAFGIYNIALTLSSYSMPLAVSKLVAARLAKGETQNAKRIFIARIRG